MLWDLLEHQWKRMNIIIDDTVEEVVDEFRNQSDPAIRHRHNAVHFGDAIILWGGKGTLFFFLLAIDFFFFFCGVELSFLNAKEKNGVPLSLN